MIKSSRDFNGLKEYKFDYKAIKNKNKSVFLRNLLSRGQESVSA